MTEWFRFTEIYNNKNIVRTGIDDSFGTYYSGEAINKLAEYETAEDEGRLVVLPCDTVYFIWDKSSGISHVRAKSILDLSLREILGIDKGGRYWSDREESEKVLKEMKKR